MKEILPLCLAVVMLLGVLAMGVSAEENPLRLEGIFCSCVKGAFKMYRQKRRGN